ncbi:hypothetical protein GCM10023347_25350 [Streptomyces chumphonensis]|uniref:Uncharacterized protein n=1 Tax=Streptomyces chumphonensis TaxID=1214925 RepID=A0A927EVI1_9ACTN|nr:hypothetical protein [Streptomyces chumphonensis]MBD3929975.1 hypothetical protein [Streptomyces chumphonensis]
MSDENDDLRITPETVHLLTKGINDAMAELRTFTSETSALRGSGFNDLTLTTMEAGAPGPFDGFCGNWEWGVRGLMQRANLVAERLDLAAGLVWAEDAYWSAKFKYAANGFVPDRQSAPDTGGGRPAELRGHPHPRRPGLQPGVVRAGPRGHQGHLDGRGARRGR